MLGGQAFGGIERLGHLALRVTKSFQHGDRFVLVRIRRRLAQGFGPIAREYGGDLFRAGFGSGDHDAVGAPQKRDRAAARAGHDRHALARGGNAVEQRGQFRGSYIGAGNVELVIHAVIGAVADQHHHQSVIRLRRPRKFLEPRADLLAIRRNQRSDVAVACLLQARIDVERPHLESLVVVRLAAEAGDRQKVSGRRRCQGSSQQQCADSHTTPHLRRNSHSDARRPSANRKMAGISQRSRASRAVMPASEYEISLASLDA